MLGLLEQTVKEIAVEIGKNNQTVNLTLSVLIHGGTHTLLYNSFNVDSQQWQLPASLLSEVSTQFCSFICEKAYIMTLTWRRRHKI